MTTPRFNPPPPPSTPKQAPWTEMESALAGLNALGVALGQTNQDLQELIAAVKAGGGGGGGGGIPLYGLYMYEDVGVATGVGTSTTLRDEKKSWLPNMWAGHTLFAVVNGIMYVTFIASNDRVSLTFVSLPSSVTITDKTPYWITSPSHVIPVVPQQIFTKDIRLIETDVTPVQDITLSQRVAIKVKSTLDQAVTIQLIGDFFNPMDTPTNINGPIAVPIGSITPSSAEIHLAYDDWQPYLAVQLSTLIAPAVGTVTVWLAGQD